LLCEVPFDAAKKWRFTDVAKAFLWKAHGYRHLNVIDARAGTNGHHDFMINPWLLRRGASL
jgi:hypothetical protein